MATLKAVEQRVQTLSFLAKHIFASEKSESARRYVNFLPIPLSQKESSKRLNNQQRQEAPTVPGAFILQESETPQGLGKGFFIHS